MDHQFSTKFTRQREQASLPMLPRTIIMKVHYDGPFQDSSQQLTDSMNHLEQVSITIWSCLIQMSQEVGYSLGAQMI